MVASESKVAENGERATSEETIGSSRIRGCPSSAAPRPRMRTASLMASGVTGFSCQHTRSTTDPFETGTFIA